MRQLLFLEDRSETVVQVREVSASADYDCRAVKTFLDFVEEFDEIEPDLVILQSEIDERMVVDCLSHLSNRKWSRHVLLICRENEAYLREVAELAKKSFRLAHVEMLPPPLDAARLKPLLKIAGGN